MSLNSTNLPPPTADELRRWEACIDLHTCMACGDTTSTKEQHHLLSAGGLRLGHRYTVMLCAHPCHSQVKWRTFKKHYPDADLLRRQDELIGWPVVELPKGRERRANRKTTASEKQVKRTPGVL